MDKCGHVVPIKQEVPCIQCVEKLESKLKELEAENAKLIMLAKALLPTENDNE